MINAIIFDFDGVLVESVDIKTQAFKNLFSFAPNHINDIIEYHKVNTGISRFEKFRHIYSSILHENLSDDRFRELSEKFSSLVIDAVVAAPCVPGAGRFLKRFSGSIPLYVISATPEEELREIIMRRQMGHFFRGIYGSPAKKADNISTLIKKEHANPKRTIYIGDAINDLNAALQAGVRFIGRIRPGVPNPFIDCEGIEKIIRDLDELSQYIGGLL